MKRYAIWGMALLLSACGNEGPGRLRATLLFPPVRAADPKAYSSAAYDTGRTLDTVRVSVLDGERVVARQEAPVSARSLEILSLAAGTYTVRAEALLAGTAVLAGRAEGVKVVSGEIADSGDIRLAPVSPAAPVVRVLPTLTNQNPLKLSGAKEMFTGITVNGASAVDVDDALAFATSLTLREGVNKVEVAAVNPDGVAGAPFSATITLDTVAPKGSLTIARGVAQVSTRTVSVELVADGAQEMRIGEQSDLTSAAWTAFAPSISYTLAAGDGLKTLYAQFRDRAGNESAVVSDSVTLKAAVQGPQLSVTPADATSGTVLTVSGMAFGVSQGTSQVVLNGSILTVQSWSNTQLTLLVGPTVPPGPGSLVVTVNEQPQPALTVYVYPTIAARTPPSGGPGANFTISGANFGAAAGTRDGVFFGDSKTTDIISWSDTLIQGVTPWETPGTDTTLRVVAGGLATAATTFSGTRPWIEGRSPRAVDSGGLVTVYGRNFGVSGSIYVNGITASPVTWTATRIDAVVPAGQPAGDASIYVVVGGTQGSNKVSVLVRGSGVWMPLDDKPFARGSVTGVWTGTEMLVWGGAPEVATPNQSYHSGAGHRYNPATDSWLPMSAVGAPHGRRLHTAVWTGKEMIVYGGSSPTNFVEDTGGRYNPFTDTWLPVAAGDAGRTEHSAVWTGTEMIVFGGSYDNTGGLYNPVSDSWTTTSTLPPLGDRLGHSAVWTGREMIVWGGRTAADVRQNSGARYDPNADTWVPISALGAPAARHLHTAVWTGREMIIFGGCCGVSGGGIYDPRADAWRATSLASVPGERFDHRAVWTGEEMIVLGGSPTPGGIRFNPATDTWMATAVTGEPLLESNAMVWTGKEVLFWGGYAPASWDVVNAIGGRYNPKTDTWAAMAGPDANVPAPRGDHSAIWTGSEMIVWGGHSGSVFNTQYNTGGRYNLATDTWLPTSTGANVPATRALHAAHWTGSEMVIWGGIGSSVALNDGARYDPATDAWAAMNNTYAPVARYDHATASAGSKLFMWGGWDGTSNFFWDGGVYDPAIDDWTGTSTGAGVLSGRTQASAVWTGSKVLVWGGWNDSQLDLNDGAAYDITADTWTAMSDVSAPTGRHGHYGVWNGMKMLVFSGSTAQNSGGAYDPVGDTWSAITPMPIADVGSAVVAVNGGDVFVFGGGTAGGSQLGYLYSAGTDTWMGLPSGTTAPFGRANATAVWTGSEVILWGGFYDNARFAWSDGLRYLP